MDWGLGTQSRLDLTILCTDQLARLGLCFVPRGHSELPSKLVYHVEHHVLVVSHMFPEVCPMAFK